MPTRRTTPGQRKPYLGKARKESRLPLDPQFLQQRGLECPPELEIPTARLKASVKHPTVFRKRIASVDSSAGHGDLVRVVDDTNQLIGFGVWNPRAEATIRMLSWGEQRPDGGWWKNKIQAAVSLRQELLQLPEQTNAYRVINAEGDGFPGLVADIYADVLSMEVFTLAMFQRSTAIAELLAETLGVSHWLIRTGPATLAQEGFLADGFGSGDLPDRVQVKENGVTFEIQPAAGHKTGFFCDQRDNRLRLRAFCSGKDVLDLCCYSGGFAINAAMAGARSITAVDLDEDAIAMARRNANLNQLRAKFVHADAFSYMRDMQRNQKTYDVVILDPPKLIRGRSELGEGRRKYFDFNQLAASLVNPGGLLITCSCSGLLSMEEFTLTVRAATNEVLPRLIDRTAAGPDHPVSMNCLETDYLKCLWMQIPN